MGTQSDDVMLNYTYITDITAHIIFYILCLENIYLYANSSGIFCGILKVPNVQV